MVVKDQQGQAIVEYILLLSALVGMFLIAARGLCGMSIGTRLSKPLTKSFAKAYQYGDVTTSGPDEDGGANNHAQAQNPQGANFRIFLNPHNK